MQENSNEVQRQFYFMAGLPRSGSSLLSTILNQNPKIFSGPSSPVTGIMLTLEQALMRDELYLAYPKEQQAWELISSVIHHYYSDVPHPIIIDKNRSWVDRVHYIEGYIRTEPKIICPVRNIDEILASFISMIKRNPFEVNGKINFIDEMLIKSGIPLTDDARCEFLASDAGILGQSYLGIKKLLEAGKEKCLHFVEYDDLVSNPEETIRKIYEFLDQEYFEHDYSQLTKQYQENDEAIYGIADMHSVRPVLKKISTNPSEILSQRIIDQCKGAEIWRDLYEFEIESTDSVDLDSHSDTKIIGE